MTQTNYRLSIIDRLVHDYDDEIVAQDIDALVASNDCFITLATQLDTVHALTTADQITTEHIIRTLIYLQRRYKITKKPSGYAQN